MTAEGDPVRVVLAGVPLALAERSDEHLADLLRESALLSLDARAASDVPDRLTALVADLETRYAEAAAAAEAARAEAADRGDATADLVLTVPRSAGPAAAGLAALLEEVDAYCRSGRHLLTVPAEPDVAAFRRWYLGQVAAQVAGEGPAAWPG